MMIKCLENVELTNMYDSLKEWLSHSYRDEHAKQFILEIYTELKHRTKLN